MAGLAASPSALVVANNVPVKSVKELIAYSKTVPQKMNFASAGVGSVSHLNFEVFMDKTGMQGVHVPYKGGGQAIGDVIAGHVPMTITSVQAVKGLVESGKIKALGVTSPARSPALPDVPTMQEAGVPAADVELRFWFAIFGPKGLPDAVKAKLVQAVTKVMTDPKVRGAPRQARHHAGRHRRPSDACKARKRDQELDHVRRRQGHQGGMTRARNEQGAGVSDGYDLIVNGKSVHVQGDGTTPLLSVLRNELGLRGSRFGCGTEQCGACMVLIDGEPSFSCARAIESLAGKRVTTVEGLAPGGSLSPLQQAFLDEQAGQCGYCLSGILISAAALLARNPHAEPRARSPPRSTAISAAAACTTGSCERWRAQAP